MQHLGSSYLQKKVAFAIDMVRGYTLGRRDKNDDIFHHDLGVYLRTSEGLDLCQTPVQKNTIFGIALRRPENEPRTATLDPIQTFFCRKRGLGDFIPALANTDIASIVVEILWPSLERAFSEIHKLWKLKKRMSHKVMGNFKAFPVEFALELLGVSHNPAVRDPEVRICDA